MSCCRLFLAAAGSLFLLGCETEEGPSASCGNGVVELGELCDTAIQLGRCPQGWGACAACARDCKTRKFSFVGHDMLPCTGTAGEFEYDDRGHQLLGRYFGEDGVVVSESMQRFDDQYRRVRDRVVSDFRHRELRYTYDAEGRLQTGWIDRDLDEQPDGLWTIEYEEDGASMTSLDSDPDGIVDGPEYTLKNEFGQIVHQWLDLDLNEEGVDLSLRNTFDAQGSPRRAERDSDGDGVLDFIQTWSRDEPMTLVYRVDQEADGEIDEESISRYDARDRILETTTYAGLASANAPIARLLTYSYDDDEGSVATSLDGDGDGVIDSRYDSRVNTFGETTFVGLDDAADGTYDRQFTYRYDDLGNVIEETSTTPEDVVKTIRVFDEMNRPVSRQETVNGVSQPAVSYQCNAALFDVLPLRLRAGPSLGAVFSAQ